MDENSPSDVKQEILALLDNHISEMFSSRDTTCEAYEYGMLLAKQEGMNKAYMATALIVYHNSLIKQLKKEIQECLN